MISASASAAPGMRNPGHARNTRNAGYAGGTSDEMSLGSNGPRIVSTSGTVVDRSSWTVYVELNDVTKLSMKCEPRRLAAAHAAGEVRVEHDDCHRQDQDALEEAKDGAECLVGRCGQPAPAYDP